MIAETVSNQILSKTKVTIYAMAVSPQEFVWGFYAGFFGITYQFIRQYVIRHFAVLWIII